MTDLGEPRSFYVHGCTVQPVLDDAIVRDLRQAIEDYVDRLARALLLAPEQTCPGVGLDERLEAIALRDCGAAEAILTAVTADAQRDPRVRALGQHQGLRERAEELSGCRLAAPTVRVRANVPALPHRRQRWHSDVARLDGTPCSRVRMTTWIPLAAVGRSSGTLEVALGARRVPPLSDPLESGGFEVRPEALGDRRQAITCGVGSVAFVGPYTPHRALPNHSGRVRWSVVCWFEEAA